jgi:hypothetical protein
MLFDNYLFLPQDREERLEIERLIQQLREFQRSANLRKYGPRALEKEWLAGANITPAVVRGKHV